MPVGAVTRSRWRSMRATSRPGTDEESIDVIDRTPPVGS